MELLSQFRDTLTDHDRVRLDEELTALAKELLSRELLCGSEDRLKQLLSEGEISPVLFQWAFVVRETYPPHVPETN